MSSQTRKLIVHAPNVHQGGGKTLLLQLLKATKDKLLVATILDRRLVMPECLSDEVKSIYVKSSLMSRIVAEYQLVKLATKTDVVFCFGNLPPILRLNSEVVLFIQNRYLVNNMPLNGFSLKYKLRIILERIWLKSCISNADRIIVQTNSMKNLVWRSLKRKSEVIPFYTFNKITSYDSKVCNKKYDFIYVATGEPQKNHYNLLKAWEILAEEKIFPSLCLTLSYEKYPSLVNYINDASKKNGLNVENVTEKAFQEMNFLYKSSGALIYPSTLESLGLPLIEAEQAGIPIIASELDYVRDIVEPHETFDPCSPLSISRAVKRFLRIKNNSGLIMPAERFLLELIPELGK